MKDSLVEYVFECSNLEFISDLKYCRDSRLYDIVKEIKPEDFPVEAWCGLYLYLFGKNIDADSQLKGRKSVLDAIASVGKGA